ncbi:Meiosis inhibitor protein 1, partial [Ophiophagus hannah]
SSSFIQLNLELKAKFCSGQSNAALNQACCSFLHSMCLSLHLSSEKMVESSKKKQEISELLWKTLPLLNFSALESLRLLSETPDPLCLNETLRNQQYSLLFLFHLAFSHEDRIVPEADLFSAISSFLLSVEDQGDCPPPYIVKAILYLLAICQHKSKALDLDLVCFGTNEVAQKVLISLKIFLRIAEDIHVCDLLRSQFLQILQQLLVENNSSISQVINLCGKCSPTDSEILQPSLNFLYWSLQQTIPSSQQIVVVLLLSNKSLIELLEKVLHCTWMATSFSEPVFSSCIESLICSAWLLTASLLTQQNIYNIEVRNTDKSVYKQFIFFIISILQFLRAFFKQNLCSSFVKFIVQSTDKQEKELPQSKENISLFPLAMWHVLSLVARLQNLLVQTVIRCLEVLLEYLHLKNQSTACHIASHPWNKFLLITLLDGNENSFLNSEILRLIS